MINRTFKLAVLLVGLVFCKFASANLILVLNDDGQLLGADNLNVEGVLYDVRFFEGSCPVIYKNCGNTDAPFNFAFDNDADKALIAANSLASQVFADGPQGLFDSQPETLFGCTSPNLCRVYVPFYADYSVRVVTFFNTANSDFIYEQNLGITLETSSRAVFAVFEASPVSAPSVLTLTLLSFLFLARRRFLAA